jgi:hypothetical protein
MLLRLLILLCCIGVYMGTQAQQTIDKQVSKVKLRKVSSFQRTNTEKNKALLLGLSTGLNNPEGMAGLHFGTQPNGHLQYIVGFGYSTWGFKANVRCNYLLHQDAGTGFALGAAVQYSTGISNVSGKANGNLYTGNLGTVFSGQVLTSYHIKIAKNMRVYTQAGLGYRLSGPKLDVAYTLSNVPIMPDDLKVIRRPSPSILNISLGYCFRVPSTKKGTK